MNVSSVQSGQSSVKLCVCIYMITRHTADSSDTDKQNQIHTHDCDELVDLLEVSSGLQALFFLHPSPGSVSICLVWRLLRPVSHPPDILTAPPLKGFLVILIQDSFFSTSDRRFHQKLRVLFRCGFVGFTACAGLFHFLGCWVS